ncbi:4Fe-4S binding protein [Candidatus Aenigmatarchaeota archaeon]
MRLIGEALKNMVKKPFTQMYPKVKPLIPEGYRGMLEHDTKKCIYCGLCAKNCPSHAIKVDMKKGTWEFDLGRCLHCSQCEETCRLVVRKNAITMNLEFEHADRKKHNFITIHKRGSK